jgi:hypothetical protein
VPKKRGRPCSICTNKKRCQIDQCVLDGASYRLISSQFKVGEKSIERHVNAGHVSKILESAAADSERKRGLDIQKCAQEIYDLCFGTAQDIRRTDPRCIGSLLGPAVKVLEILNKGNDEDKDRPGLDRALDRMKADRDARRNI